MQSPSLATYNVYWKQKILLIWKGEMTETLNEAQASTYMRQRTILVPDFNFHTPEISRKKQRKQMKITGETLIQDQGEPLPVPNQSQGMIKSNTKERRKDVKTVISEWKSKGSKKKKEGN